MIVLQGENLGQRQKSLNLKVNEAFKNNINIEQLELDDKELDADVLFKIDLAAKTKNIDYIINILKKGDELYISRALKKCKWLGDKEFENIINVEYLKQNIFPFMSVRMKKKLICTLQFYLKNENIIIEFYNYCFENKLLNEASKFLLLAPEIYKSQIIHKYNGLPNFDGYSEGWNYLKIFIKDSFTLLEDCVKIVKYSYVLLYSIHMYKISDLKFLHLLETYGITIYFNKKTSEHILKKHNNRVLRYPRLYLNCLKRNMVIKYCSIDDAKLYAVALFENYEPYEFAKFCNDYNYIIDIIPEGERFQFLKETFLIRFPDNKFDMNEWFFRQHLYFMMTEAQLEEWALRHIESGDEIFGIDKDYIWYQFVKFEKAFTPIKRYVEITPDRNIRLVILKVLIDSVRSQKDIEVLLNHFYVRHINEMQHCKEDFLNTLILKHNVLEFNRDCWEALEKIFYSLDVFNKQNMHSSYRDYRHIALLYYVIHKEKVPDVLNEYICMDEIYFYVIAGLTKTPEHKDLIYNYLYKMYSNKIESLSRMPYDEAKDEINRKVETFLMLLSEFGKTKTEIPEMVYQFIRLDHKRFNNHILSEPNNEIEIVNKEFNENDIKRYLKRDSNLLITEFPKIKKYLKKRQSRINWVLRKLRIYFTTDLAKQYLNLLVECLSNDELLMCEAKTVVFAVYVLGDDSFKNNFLKRYVPITEKIDHSNIPISLLNIQKAICGLVIHSRPQIPLHNYLPFVAGDYIHFCLPIINAYRMRLPTPQFTEFVKSILDKPVSIQKHGLRLAFTCFTTEYLVDIVYRAWEKTKNVSLRKLIYESLFNKTINAQGEEQTELFELLKNVSGKFKEDDDESLFRLWWSSRLPKNLNIELITIGWNTVSNFPVKSKNLQRLHSIVLHVNNNIETIPDEIIDIIINPYIEEYHEFEELPKKPAELIRLREEKQRLMKKYVMLFKNSEQLQKRIHLIKHISQGVFKSWNKQLGENNFVARNFFYSFVNYLENTSITYLKSYNFGADYMYGINVIFIEILKETELTLSKEDLPAFILKLQLHIIVTQIMAESLDSYKPNYNLKEQSKAAVQKLASQCANLIKEYVTLNAYDFIRNYARKRIENTLSYFTNFISYWSKTYNVSSITNEVLIIFCEHLVEYENREIKELVASLMDKYNYDHYKQIYLILERCRETQENDGMDIDINVETII